MRGDGMSHPWKHLKKTAIMLRIRPIYRTMTEKLLDADCWIFDLDNTLYPVSCVIDEIDRRMRNSSPIISICCPTRPLISKRYFHEFGTTLKGLMTVHGMEPGLSWSMSTTSTSAS